MIHFKVKCRRDGSFDTFDFIPCVAIGKIAKNICKNLQKGSFLLVEGSNQNVSVYKKGVRFDSMEVFVKNVIFLNSPEQVSSIERFI